jgi:adhesin/invasin
VLSVACHHDTEAPVAPSSTAKTPVATKLVAQSGSDLQVGQVGLPLNQPVIVQVLDAGNAPMAGVTVQWSVTGGGGSIDNATSTTDSNGNAVVYWTMGTVAGGDALQATVGTGLSLTVNATAHAGPVTQLLKLGGDEQTIPEGGTSAPFVVRAVDKYGNGVAGVTIDWTPTAGAMSANETVTNASGMAQVTLTADPAQETFEVVAAAGDGIAVTFTAATAVPPTDSAFVTAHESAPR